MSQPLFAWGATTGNEGDSKNRHTPGKVGEPKIISELEPTGIIVYGPASDDIFGITRLKSIPIYQYDSYTMKENKKDRERKLSEVKTDER